ncbi:proton-coupled folate transporter isoform X2 [Acyrthosiphon pisum]|uniref:Proton-coupled folate transporter n=1 Tax=Acyrthosiphon pisum TaxID=7029 RepID=A0A8R2JXC3_ACYPI|nr:proton-coupled folate transporter isoform X2 [Acyrthosiphon pisum]
MDDSEPSDCVEIKNRKSGLTLEPIMMLMCLGINANQMVQTNLFEERVCLHSDLGQNKSVNCYNMTAADLEIVQPAVADLQMIKNLIETLVPCITALFLGPWSDVNGRLPLLLTAISGMVISNCMYSAFSTIPSLTPIMFLLCSIPVAVSGGYGALFMAASCYIVDITDCKSRAFRLGVLFAFVSFGSILGSVLSSILYGKSTTYSFCLSSFVSIVGLLYTYIFLKETIVIKKGADTKLFNIKLVKDMWQTVTKQRFGYLRSIIILSAVLLTLNLIVLFGEASFMYMYLQKQFSWTLENYTPFLVYTTLIHATIPVIALGIFEKVGLAYSVHRWQFYAMKTVGYTVYISQSLVRSQLSKSLPSEDICKIFAFLSVIENFGVLLYSPMYTAVYVMTIHDFANCFFFLSAILGMFVFILFGYLQHILQLKDVFLGLCGWMSLTIQLSPYQYLYLIKSVFKVSIKAPLHSLDLYHSYFQEAP